uniref:Ubiquitin thioesterase OTU n=1 Tax=Dunaliella tertiolecta TaxID=3047 RepID=A0A6S8NJB3_DUNTE|mmetsp:Transcript_17634/g.46201  ORF Transcript_17634/g.46201 Transcript_17634/m.46201 type:complete len:451 (+) Transcript_17634:1819-3171(+)|eukprot:CAMPEP_0202373872 /NCGR_PEP_ID=MMETSP1127-20130417/4816_1 /ASSEMBLY_ACC=CAM_ASM_000462 /TAXON_ID=3047 /ORGANISM="Dunaliella tertiolecta, Strain CCMP1320" /LENGTH=450 /DNA_ID=CAMNT_0048970875 /DNA_START=1767 /DNA_END=3119 /DNA_ORIENTATION=+
MEDEQRWQAKLLFFFILKMSLNNDNGRGGAPTKSSLAAAKEEAQSQQQPAEHQGQGQQSLAAPPQQPQQAAPSPQLAAQQQQAAPQAQRPPNSVQSQGQPPRAGQQQQQQQQQQQEQAVLTAQPQQQRQVQQRPGQQPRPSTGTQRPPGTRAPGPPRPPSSQPRQLQPVKAPPSRLQSLKKPLPLALLSSGSLAAGALLVWGVVGLIRRGRKRTAGAGATATGATPGPCSKVKPTQKCVPLADGSACVIRREIPADNSCLFNAIGYVMHGSKTKASFLRSVVAREVSSDPAEYNEAFLGMSNMAYCNWIMQPINWGGGIELAILSRHYGREIAAWNIESKKPSIFGEEQGYPRHVMIIYTGSHYDALAIAKHPKAPESEDKVEFNPRTKSGKMAIAAAQKLTELAHRSSKFYRPPIGLKLRCRSCKTVCKGQGEVELHAKKTGHQKFDQI